jgi:hypothetical protein
MQTSVEIERERKQKCLREDPEMEGRGMRRQQAREEGASSSFLDRRR